MAHEECRVTLLLALDPQHWRNDDKAGWAVLLIGAVEAAAPRLLHIESYEIRDTIVYLRMRTNRSPSQFRKLLRDDDALIRLRARLGDLGARPDFEIEEH